MIAVVGTLALVACGGVEDEAAASAPASLQGAPGETSPHAPELQSQAVERVRPVQVESPRAVTNVHRIRAIGRLQAVDEMRLSFRSGGVIAFIAVDIGDRVRAGQILARLESTELDAAAASAAEQTRKAERDLARARELIQRALVSHEALDNAATDLQIARANEQAALFAQRHSRIVAPASGRVLARSAEQREVVVGGQEVLAVSAEEKGWLLRAHVSDRDALSIQPGASAEVSFDAYGAQRFPARVARIAGTADATGTFQIEVALSVPPERFRSGMIGRVDIEAVDVAGGLAIPTSALVQADAEEGAVFVVNQSRAKLTPVRIRRLGEALIDVEGLTADAAVVTGGAFFVDDGQLVKVVQ